MNSQNMPRVSIITPTTYSRSNFIPLLVNNVVSQTYPHDCLEWVVVGDLDRRTKEEFQTVFRNIKNTKCNYYECDILDDIGRKRNFACSVAKNKIFANMDSDDFYQKSYIEYSVKTMKSSKVNLVGSRDMLVFYPLVGGKMTMVRGSSAHEASIVCTKKHWAVHKYGNTSTGEGANMIQGCYENNLDIRKIMVCFAHDSNTFSKDSLLGATSVDVPDDMRLMLTSVYSMCK